MFRTQVVTSKPADDFFDWTRPTAEGRSCDGSGYIMLGINDYLTCDGCAECEAPSEVDQLREKVAKLEAENAALRARR